MTNCLHGVAGPRLPFGESGFATTQFCELMHLVRSQFPSSALVEPAQKSATILSKWVCTAAQARISPELEQEMPLITSDTKSVFVIAVTPFEENGAIDHASINRMIDLYCHKGTDGLTILGMIGEASKLTQNADGGAKKLACLARVSG
jgi:hypothetical protein